MDLSEVFQWVFLSVDVGGVVVAGVLGGMVARERRFDLVGFVALALMAALGGGMLRDVAVGRTPAIFGGNTLYATGALAATIPAMALWHARHPSLALIAATLVGGIVCTAARWYKWRLPLNDDYSLGRTYRQVRASFEEYTRMREAGLLRRRRTEAVEIRARHSRRRRGRGLGRGRSR